MFNFFKRKSGKAEAAPGTVGNRRKRPSEDATAATSVDPRSRRNDNDVTNEKTSTLRKDVVNLLLPEMNYNQKSGVGALLQMMAGKKKKEKTKTVRTESCRVSPQKETSNVNLQRSKSDLETKKFTRDDVAAPTPAENNPDAPRADADPADFVKALVLQKYANKTPLDAKQHVSLVYVTDEPELDEKRHAEALLREIAKRIDCTVDSLNVNKAKQMGTTDSKAVDKEPNISKKIEPAYETIEERNTKTNNNSINNYKNELKGELEKLLKNEDNKENKGVEKLELETAESPAFPKKSNLKPPRSDTEGCSDDDRSESGKKRITFSKHIVFDDGEQQTDEEVDSSFESLISEEEEDEEEEYIEDSVPDNDELLGGVVVSRNDENKTVININEPEIHESQINNEPIKIKIECPEEKDTLHRNFSDNSDSGFIEISDKQNESGDDLTSDLKSVEIVEIESESETETEVTESETEEEIEEEVEIEEIEEEEISIAEIIEPTDPKHVDNKKTLVTQENKFQSQVAALTELADSRCGEAERARELISSYRKEIETKDQQIEKLKSDLSVAYKESELIRQRSRSLEEELAAARSCSADLAQQLQRKNNESIRQLRSELDEALTRRAELESKVLALEQNRERLEEEKALHEQRAEEAIAAAEANTTKWRAAHEAARSQAAAGAELMLADCEWKMRTLEKRAREAEKKRDEFSKRVEDMKTAPPTANHVAELQQLRGLATEQQRSVQSLTLQLQKVETREEALKLEVHRLKELLDRETKIGKEKEERHFQTIQRLEQQHSKNIETLKSEHAASAASTRATLERTHAERTRAALAQLRDEAERDMKNADRKLREVTNRFENLKEVLAAKEAQFERAIAEAHSKADWDILQLRHLLDKADINYANNVEQMNERFEKETERLIAEWSEKVRAVEEQATKSAEEARKLLETTRTRLVSEKNEQINKLKDQHRREMDDQWEQFMTDKENCLTRMKEECKQEGDEERVKREKELLEEIAELRAEIQTKTSDFDNLAVKAAACGRTLAVTEQELREALAREKELRDKRSEDASKIKQAERAGREQVEHLNRKCACLRKLFDDMRARLAAREHSAEQDTKSKEKELHQLRAEVARLTKILVEQSSPKLGTRTCADGCEDIKIDESFLGKIAPPASDAQTNGPRRKGGTLKTPEMIRKRLLTELLPLPPEGRLTPIQFQNGRRRAKSVDLPAVQVPVRIKQLEEKTKE